jgi:hypothetical protein
MANLVPRACDPREGTWGSGIIRCRKPGILAKIELRIPYQWPIRFFPETDYPRASRSFPRIAGSGNEIAEWLIGMIYSFNSQQQFLSIFGTRKKVCGFTMTSRSKSFIFLHMVEEEQRGVIDIWCTSVLRRISSPRTKLFAARCECLHLIKINCLALWLDESAHACTRSELRGASCEDWKSALTQGTKGYEGIHR